MGPTRIRITIDPSPGKARGKAREVFKRANAEQARDWKRLYLPQHFRRGAGSRYGYQSRTIGYLKRKRSMIRRGKARAPERHLVLTGLTEDKAVRARGLIRPYPTRATLTLYTPSYVKIRPYKRNAPNLHDEITRVTTPERDDLGKRFGARVDKGLQDIKSPHTVTIG